MAWYLSRYVCPSCKDVWDDEWSSACDNECGRCGQKHIAPVSTEDVTVVLEKNDNGAWEVWASPTDAEDKPRYALLGRLTVTEAGRVSFRQEMER